MFQRLRLSTGIQGQVGHILTGKCSEKTNWVKSCSQFSVLLPFTKKQKILLAQSTTNTQNVVVQCSILVLIY